MIDDPHFHFQLFLYLFTFVAAVGLGLLFVKQKGVADAADNAADLPLTYQDGARVELVGLRKASLNGATGHVVKELDAGTGRIAVKLISGREVAVKPENLKLAEFELILDNPHHVEKKYNEAVAVAVESCADDTKGHSQALYGDPGASLDDLREAVTTLEDTARIARRVLGGEHPLTAGVEKALGKSRAAYDTRRGVLEALAGGHGVDLATLRQTYRA